MRKLVTIGLNITQAIANPVFNFLIIIFGVKIFGKSNWASLIDVMLWAFLVSFILGWGNRDYLLRKYSEQPNKMYNAFFSHLISRSFMLPLTLIFFLFFNFQTALLIIIYVIILFLYNSLNTLVVYHQKFSALLKAEILGFFIIFGALFLLNTFNLQLFISIYCLAIFFKFIVLSFYLKYWKENFSFYISFNNLKLSTPFFILGLSGWLISKIDIYLVALFLEKNNLAEYQLFITSFLMLQALSAYITIPFTKHIYRLSKKTLLKIKYKLYAVSIPIVVIGAICIWIIMECFVKLGFPNFYYGIGCLIAIPCFFYAINIMELYKKHKEKTIIYISFCGLIINSVLILALIESYQLLAVLISVAITQWSILFFYKLNWHLNN